MDENEIGWVGNWVRSWRIWGIGKNMIKIYCIQTIIKSRSTMKNTLYKIIKEKMRKTQKVYTSISSLG